MKHVRKLANESSMLAVAYQVGRGVYTMRRDAVHSHPRLGARHPLLPLQQLAREAYVRIGYTPDSFNSRIHLQAQCGA